jgi:hypothetical protein
VTGGQRAALIAAAAAAALLAWAALVPGGRIRAVAGVDTSDPGQAGQPDLWLCPASEIPGGTLPGRHGLFRRHDGAAMRAALQSEGWAWFASPPADQGL